RIAGESHLGALLLALVDEIGPNNVRRGRRGEGYIDGRTLVLGEYAEAGDGAAGQQLHSVDVEIAVVHESARHLHLAFDEGQVEGDVPALVGTDGDVLVGVRRIVRMHVAARKQRQRHEQY